MAMRAAMLAIASIAGAFALGPSAAAGAGLSSVGAKGALSASSARAAHQVFLAVSPVGSYELELMVGKGPILAGSGAGTSPNLMVSLIKPSAAGGTELDAFAFHLKGAYLSTRGSTVHLATGSQLGSFGSINLVWHGRHHGPLVGCGGRLAAGFSGVATGSFRFVPGGAHFGTISRTSLPASLVTVSLSRALGSCHGAHLTTAPPSKPTECPPSPALIATAGLPSIPGSPTGSTGTPGLSVATAAVTDVIASTASGHAAVTVMHIEPRAPAVLVAHLLSLPGLPVGDFTASGATATLQSSSAAPYLTGALSYTGNTLPSGPACLSVGSFSGDLTAHFDSIGELALSSGEGLLAD